MISKSSIFFHPLIIEFFQFAKLWVRIEENIYIKAIADVSRRGKVLQVVLPERETNDLLGERKSLPGGPGVGETVRINYKRNFIQDSFQRFS